MELMMRLAVLAVAAVFCAGVVRRGAPEFALLVALAAGIGILFLTLEGIREVLAVMERMAQAARLDPALIAPVGKTVALAIVTRITGEICRSAGEGGVASLVEIGGTVLALGAALPLVEAVLQMMTEILT